jgi:phosphatidylserine decarboxylase
VSDALAVLPQHFLPKKFLTQLAGRLAHWRGGSLTTAMIRAFVRRYRVDMAEAANSDIAGYATFNEFFTRELRAGARPLAQARYVCPVDGAISQIGAIANGQIFQAKGHSYSARALLGGDAQLAQAFDDGHFATLYLSPRDYHRIHMPCAGSLRRMVYIPGDLFSVNPTTARSVPGLFARNERVVCMFDTAQGPLALVLVGATIVGSMATVWHGQVNPPRSGRVREWSYASGVVELDQGQEMGRFMLGSTVVLLFTRGAIGFSPDWADSRQVRMGERMGEAPAI